MDMPKNVQLETRSDGLVIAWPTLGSRWRFLVLVPVPLFWFLVLTVAFVSFSADPPDIGVLFALALLTIPFLVVIYYLAVGLLNSSAVEISRDVLRTRCGPIPYARAKAISSARVRQVYITLRTLGMCILHLMMCTF